MRGSNDDLPDILPETVEEWFAEQEEERRQTSTFFERHDQCVGINGAALDERMLAWIGYYRSIIPKSLRDRVMEEIYRDG